ncbi:MAG: UvrB/UvrC motif-containing protein [Verrucomicrobiota bacterium]
MDCDVCDKSPATVFFSNVVDGKVQKVNLCKSCADENGVNDPTNYALMDMLDGMGEEESLASSQTGDGELSCPTCNFGETDFKKTGRFGCSNWYQVFDNGLDDLLEAMHKNTEHNGKVPSANQTEHTAKVKSSKEEELEGLKDQLSQAVDDEAYEKAAILRDEIRRLEDEISQL